MWKDQDGMNRYIWEKENKKKKKKRLSELFWDLVHILSTFLEQTELPFTWGKKTPLCYISRKCLFYFDFLKPPVAQLCTDLKTRFEP